jgi:hypothetical protein
MTGLYVTICDGFKFKFKDRRHHDIKHVTSVTAACIRPLLLVATLRRD